MSFFHELPDCSHDSILIINIKFWTDPVEEPVPSVLMYRQKLTTSHTDISHFKTLRSTEGELNSGDVGALRCVDCPSGGNQPICPSNIPKEEGEDAAAAERQTGPDCRRTHVDSEPDTDEETPPRRPFRASKRLYKYKRDLKPPRHPDGPQGSFCLP